MSASTFFPALVLCAALVVASSLAGQQAAPLPQKALTPEQKDRQQQWSAWSQKRQQLQAQGRQVFAEETAREKAGDCQNAETTYDFNVCFGRQLQLAEASLKSYQDIIRQLMTPPPGETPAPLQSASAPTPGPLQAEFDRVEQTWQPYRQTACTAAFHQFSGGSGGPSFEEECELKLTRDHLRELDMIYGAALHL